MALEPEKAVELVEKRLLPKMEKERASLDRIDNWSRWEHEKPHAPKTSTREYKELTGRSWTPWGALIVGVIAQECYVDGYARDREGTNLPAWDIWQANGLDARQMAVHRAALTYGQSYVIVLPGELDGAPMPVIRGRSPRTMIAVYDSPADDDWPRYALQVETTWVDGTKKLALRLYDDNSVFEGTANEGGDRVEFQEPKEHGAAVCPVVRFANMLDLEGRSVGEIEPVIPVLGRIDQGSFDRLIVQRFSSWIVRTISGMSPPERLEGETEDEWRERTKIRLRADDILVADDEDTRFGSLPATDLSGFINAYENDVRTLAAVSQTPATEMLGQIANLSAEALAAAEASKSRKVAERRQSFGESWEQVLRLASAVNGDVEGAKDRSAQVRWRDTEFRAAAQLADALAKQLAIGVPPEMLWEKLPGWTDQDTERAKRLLNENDSVAALLRSLEGGQQSPPIEGQ